MVADIDQMRRALRNAHNSGDENAARRIAGMIKAQSALDAQNVQSGAPVEPQAQGASGTMNAAQSGAMGGLSMGFDDEMYGAAAALPNAAINYFRGNGFDVGDAYAQGRDAYRQRKGELQKNNPIASTVGEIGGGLAFGGGASKAGLTLAKKGANTIKRRVAAGMGESAIYGTGYGIGNADGQNIVKEAAKGATIGAVTGGLFEGVAGGLASRAARKATKANAPSKNVLADEASALYKQADDAGIVVNEAASRDILREMKATPKRVNNELNPKTIGVIKYIDDMGQGSMSLADLDELRQVVGKAMQKADPTDKMHLTKMKRVLDKRLDSLGKGDITGDAAGLDAITAARDLWHRKSKADVLDGVYENALDKATGFENGLVSELRSLSKLNRDGSIKRDFAKFSKDEQKMIKDLVRRGTPRSILRGLGMLSPTSTFGGMATGGAAVGASIPAAAAMAGVGAGARKMAGRSTLKKFDSIGDAVRSGRGPVRPNGRVLSPAAMAPLANAGQQSIRDDAEAKREAQIAEQIRQRILQMGGRITQ